MQDFDRLLALRTLYRMRGPSDGAPGILPDGKVGLAIRYNLRAVMADINLNALFHPVGKTEPPVPVNLPPWTDEPCPARTVGLTHTADRHIKADGTCVHCGSALRWRPRGMGGLR